MIVPYIDSNHLIQFPSYSSLQIERVYLLFSIGFFQLWVRRVADITTVLLSTLYDKFCSEGRESGRRRRRRVEEEEEEKEEVEVEEEEEEEVEEMEEEVEEEEVVEEEEKEEVVEEEEKKEEVEKEVAEEEEDAGMRRGMEEQRDRASIRGQKLKSKYGEEWKNN